MNELLICGLMFCGIAKQDDLPPELIRQVTALLRTLNQADEPQRIAAEKELLELGPAANSALDKVFDDLPKETQIVVARVQAIWDKELSKAKLQASKIHLTGRMTLADALNEIGGQSGTKIIGGEQAEQMVDFGAQDLDFWQALDQVLKGTSYRLYPYGGEEGELRIVDLADELVKDSPPVSYDGPFRIEALRCEATRDFARPAASQLRVVLGLQWEPRLRPIAFQQPMKEVRAITGLSNTHLIVLNPDVVIEAAVQPNIPYVEMSIPFALDSPTTAEISELSGTLYAIVPGPTEQIEFLDLDEKSRGKESRKGGLVVRLEYFGREDTIFTVRVRLKFDSANGALESYRGWVGTSQFELNDGMGTTFSPLGSEVSLLSDSEASMRLLFAKDPESLNFVVRSPTNIHRVPIKFNLRRLNLP